MVGQKQRYIPAVQRTTFLCVHSGAGHGPGIYIPMRRLCPNNDSKNFGIAKLETVLEVPLPEELFVDPATDGATHSKGNKIRLLHHRTNPWTNWRPININSPPKVRNADLPLLLGVIGTPLIPCSTVSTPTIYPSITKRNPQNEAVITISQRSLYHRASGVIIICIAGKIGGQVHYETVRCCDRR